MAIVVLQNASTMVPTTRIAVVMTPAQKKGSFLFSQNDTRSRVEPTSQVRPSGDVAVIVVIGAHPISLSSRAIRAGAMSGHGA